MATHAHKEVWVLALTATPLPGPPSSSGGRSLASAGLLYTCRHVMGLRNGSIVEIEKEKCRNSTGNILRVLSENKEFRMLCKTICSKRAFHIHKITKLKIF
jgi:hypothetical protein